MLKRKLLTPFQRFVEIEGLSGILLLIATVIAMVWVNSPYGDSYQALWQYKIGISTETFQLYKPLILWVNDGLMAIFFFLIGLEIKREFLIGELDSPGKVAFPLVAAVGGILVPVSLFFLLNQNPETSNGWGIPMATDIAFSLAILKLLGNRVPLSLKIFLTAFAIVDDIGAVLAIAIFYSSSIDITYLGIGLILLAILYILAYRGIYSEYLFLILGLIIWALFLKSGIHPTVAGILMAFTIPVQQQITTSTFIDNLMQITERIKKASILNKPVLSKEQIAHIDDLENWTDSYQSPLQKLEHDLHDWVAFFIIPVFALANAGVLIKSDVPLDLSLVGIIAICLVLGKSIGISSVVFLASKMKLIKVTSGLTNQHIIGVSFLAGVGFTMAIFIANLAFAGDPEHIDSAKIGILTGSITSAIIGYVILRWNTKPEKYN